MNDNTTQRCNLLKTLSTLFIVAVIIILPFNRSFQNKLFPIIDSVVTLEGRNPGYWEYLKPDYYNNFYSVDLDGDGDNETFIYFVSKLHLNEITYKDFKLFERESENINKASACIIYFFDGTGLLYKDGEWTYNSFNPYNWSERELISEIKNDGKILYLPHSKSKLRSGVNGISCDISKNLNEIEDINIYLQKIKDMRGTVVISAMDDASSGWNDALSKMFQSIGLQYTLQNNFRYSYIAVVNDGMVIYENSAKDDLDADVISNGLNLHIHSGQGDSNDCYSSIQIDGVEYSQNMRGLNMVALDDNRNIIDIVNFDTYDRELNCRR